MHDLPPTHWERRPRPKPADDEAGQRIRHRVSDVLRALEIGPVDPLGPLWPKGVRFQCEHEGTLFAHRTQSGLRQFVARVIGNRLTGRWAADPTWIEQAATHFEQFEAARNNE